MCDPVFYMRVKLTWNIKFLTNSQPLLCDCCLLVCQVPLTSHLLLVVPCGQRRLLELLDLPDARTVCYGPGSCQLANMQGDFSPDSPLWGGGGGTGWLNGIHGRAAAAQCCPQMQAKLAVTAQKSRCPYAWRWFGQLYPGQRKEERCQGWSGGVTMVFKQWKRVRGAWPGEGEGMEGI